MEKNAEQKKGFVLYKDLLGILASLSNEEMGMLFRAILEYENNVLKKEHELPGSVAMAFQFIKKDLDINAAKYKETCKARSEAGKKSAESKKRAKENRSEINDSESDTHDEAGVTFAESNSTNSTNVNFVEELETKLTDMDLEKDNDEKNDIIFLDDSKKARETCVKFLGLYNQYCPSLVPADIKPTSERMEIVSNALGLFSEQEILSLFKKAENSRYLAGYGPDGWKASFDWLMKTENLNKVMTRTYSCPTPKKVHAFQQRDYDFEKLEKQLLCN